jgi:hypothetical protein
MKLAHLTNETLNSDLLFLVQQERNTLSRILWHLREVDRRKLYSHYKCGSLFEYGVKILKYSEGQSSRRVLACRMLKDVPELSQVIEEGGINITQVSQLGSFFKDEEITDPRVKFKVIRDVEGKSTRETEKILGEMRKEKPEKKVSLLLKEETVEELKKIKALKAHKFKDMDELLMGVSKEVLSLWNPMKASRKMKQGAGNSRYVQVQTKSQVWKRDLGRCQNCGSTYALQMDHIKAFAAGGKSTADNLRLLCRNCNQSRGYVSPYSYRI